MKVKLEDGEYRPKDENPNHYIVHEHHIFKVINELLIAGASAVAINGQRINHNSYIVCTGLSLRWMVISFLPHLKFQRLVIRTSLFQHYTMTGGVRDQLVNDNIVFSIEKKKQIMLEPILGES